MDKDLMEGVAFLAGTVITSGLTAWNRYSDRKNQKEKANATSLNVAKELVAHAERVRDELDAQAKRVGHMLEDIASRLTQNVKAQTGQVLTKLDINTALTEKSGEKAEKAYSEANNFNAKQAALTAEIVGQKGEIARNRAEITDQRGEIERMHRQIADLLRGPEKH